MKEKISDNITSALRHLVGWLGLIGIYWLGVLFKQDPLLLPPVEAVVKAIGDLLFSSDFWNNVEATIFESGFAILLAVIAGVPIGLLIGTWSQVRAMIEAPIDWMRSIPATALFPMMLLFFGIGSNTRIAIATYGSVFPVLISSVYGAASTSKDRLNHARRLGFGLMGRLRHVVIWESMPSVLAGIRLGISAALVLIVVGEMFIGARRGLGYLIIYYQSRYAIEAMYAVIIITGFLGFLLNRFFQVGEQYVKKLQVIGGQNE